MSVDNNDYSDGDDDDDGGGDGDDDDDADDDDDDDSDQKSINGYDEPKIIGFRIINIDK